MSWQSQALGGPVLAWEMKRATRRKLWRGLQIGYCAWLVVQAVAMFLAVLSASWDLPNEPRSRLELYRTMYAQQIEFLDNYLDLLLQIQLVLVSAIFQEPSRTSLGPLNSAPRILFGSTGA